MKHLWEVKHDYYCSHSNECHLEYDSWDGFLEEWGDADLDYNLLFRWDWNEGEDYELTPGKARMCLFYFLQRKARPQSVWVNVTRDDETRIKEFLEPRMSHLFKLWEPLGMHNP